MRDREPLILISESNRALGTASKLTIHRKGLLHRAFSIFLVDSRGRILLQKRQTTKYHSGGLWANTCCGHPRPGETTRAAATRRLGEELQLSADLKLRFHTRYQVDLGSHMQENEFVYVYFGRLQGQPQPNPEEVSAIDLQPLAGIREWCESQPASLAVWLRLYLRNHYRELAQAVRDTSKEFSAAASRVLTSAAKQSRPLGAAHSARAPRRRTSRGISV